MNFDLENKNIVVVGGKGHLGTEICASLKSQMANVISIDLKNNSKTQNLANVLEFESDVTNRKSLEKIIKKIKKVYQKIDAVIYSVTGKPQDFYSSFTTCSISGWKHVLEIELDGAFNISQMFGKIMEDQKFGNFIFISSIYGIVGNDHNIYKGSHLSEVYLKKNKGSQESKAKEIFSHAAYPVAKGGIISFSRFLAAYWGNKNIRVNCISPGGIEKIGENNTFVKKYSKKVPLGRKAKVDDITGAVLYLLSDSSSYVTGQNLVVDGGYTIW